MPCMAELPIANVYLAREMARRGDRDDAIPLMRAALDHLFREGQLLVWGTPATGFWCRHCSTARPTVTWPKPRPPLSG